MADAELSFIPGWLGADEAASAFGQLRDSIAWQCHRIRMFGRMVDSPRLSCWIGDADAHYRYSGSDFLPQPWLPVLQAWRERLQSELGHRFNSVLANYYRDGADAMGWHSDNEPELGPEPVIASLSLGATRRFLLKHRTDPQRRLTIELPPGSLLVMAGGTQAHYRHALPRTARPVGGRINLTFRWVNPG
ncbi:alpha-ketoglutarate-dependent dioxygenase AlkB family protein [Pseudoxanthomonas dokdonensis]|uniref:DNA methylase n=1 Tax=Pseudoxanthomonas dokdonensis TaxID=344882 RepID=A0A0R0CI75_9GAMM|nr:alpha-ketoglutarate-dependent dioxygenase AlkB [Pseudoxanthomonas dokdonensis]KRG69628.1 DNA methylase [Pseudoxanthomonas dokdonensis]